MRYSPDDIASMTPDERFLAQDDLCREWAFRRGWTDLQGASPRRWPGKIITITARDLRARDVRANAATCQQCHRRYEMGDRVQQVKERNGASGNWPRLLVCFSCMDRYLDWLTRYNSFVENQQYQVYFDQSQLPPVMRQRSA